MKRILALACAALLAGCSSGADLADDGPASDSTLDVLTGKSEKAADRARERIDQAQKNAAARAADAGADEPR